MTVRFEREGHVARLTINRPQALNAMDSHAHFALSEALDVCEADEDIRIIVLTGAEDRAFCVGRDLKELAAEATMTDAERAALADRWSRTRRLTDRHDFTKPIVGRINGLALGGGFEIALACDILIAVDSARFGLPEPLRGLIPFAGGVHRLPRQIPLKVAMGYLLTGRQMDAARAFDLGIVNAVVPASMLDAEVDRWVADILACAPLAFRAIKQCVMSGLDHPLSDAMRGDYPFETARQASADSQEGPRAFAEKRKPIWTGR